MPVLAQVLGAILVVAGIAAMSIIAATITAGIMLLAAGTFAELSKERS